MLRAVLSQQLISPQRCRTTGGTQEQIRFAREGFKYAGCSALRKRFKSFANLNREIHRRRCPAYFPATLTSIGEARPCANSSTYFFHASALEIWPALSQPKPAQYVATPESGTLT